MKSLKENEFSDILAIKDLEGLSFQKLLDASNSDAIIKIKILNKSQFCFKVINHCGYIAIGKDLYFISPRLGPDFLQTVLGTTQQSRYRVSEAKMGFSTEAHIFDELIAYIFICAYEKNIKFKHRKDYVSSFISSYNSAGSLNVQASKEFLCYGTKNPVWLQHQWSHESLPNLAMGRLFRFLAQKLAISKASQIHLLEIAGQFSDADPVGFLDYTAVLESLDRSYEHYRPLFILASQLKFIAGIREGLVATQTMLFPTWFLFEEACRNEITRKVPYTVSKSEALLLKISEGSRNFLSPDIIIRNKANQIINLGDCKYTENEDAKLIREHLFQLNTYMDACNLKRSFLLYPSKAYETKSYPLYWGKELTVIKIPMSSYREFSSAIQIHVDDWISDS